MFDFKRAISMLLRSRYNHHVPNNIMSSALIKSYIQTYHRIFI